MPYEGVLRAANITRLVRTPWLGVCVCVSVSSCCQGLSWPLKQAPQAQAQARLRSTVDSCGRLPKPGQVGGSVSGVGGAPRPCLGFQ